MRQVQLPTGTSIPALGQGTWRLGEGQRSRAEEADALRLGLDLGMTLIDTAEMYADGGSEEVVADAIAGQRARAFVVSKVYPHNATRRGAAQACARSLKRLRTDYIDLYLLHWRGGAPLAETVEAFERLCEAGHIRAWGVSNLDTADIAELLSVPGGASCAANQVLYNPEHRGIEYDLLPACTGHHMPIMAYSPIGQAGRLLRSPALVQIAARHTATPAQIAIAWSLRHPTVISIPKSGSTKHVRENAASAVIDLTAEDIAGIDAEFPIPRRKQGLAML